MNPRKPTCGPGLLQRLIRHAFATDGLNMSQFNEPAGRVVVISHPHQERAVLATGAEDVHPQPLSVPKITVVFGEDRHRRICGGTCRAEGVAHPGRPGFHILAVGDREKDVGRTMRLASSLAPVAEVLGARTEEDPHIRLRLKPFHTGRFGRERDVDSDRHPQALPRRTLFLLRKNVRITPVLPSQQRSNLFDRFRS